MISNIYMKFSIYISIAFFSLCPPAFSEEKALIISSENGEYSRLVVSAQMLGTFQTRKEPSKITLLFNDFQSGFDLSNIFTKANLTRIKKVSSKQNSLAIWTSCACVVKAYNVGESLLIIDVMDAVKNIPKPVKTLKGSELPQPIHFGAPPHFLFPERKKNTQNPPSLPLHSFRFKPIKTTSAPVPSTERILALQTSEKNKPKQLSDAQIRMINNLQTQLVDGLGAASTRGVLTQQDSDTIDEITAPFLSDSTQSGKIPPPEAIENLTFSSSLDGMNTALTDTRTFEPTCTPSDRYNVSQWSDGQSFDQQIGAAHVKLYDTIGNFNPAAAKDLARIYIHFGFGAEAKHIIQLDPEINKNFPELLLMAQILDDQPMSSKHFEQQSECETPAVLWAALGSADSVLVNTVKKDQALLELSALPIYLRRILAPKLSALFLKYGNPELAKASLQTLSRSHFPFDDNAVFEEAEILLATDQKEKALKKFEEIPSNASKSVDALLKKTKLKIDSGLTVNLQDRELLESYITEFKGTSIGNQLQAQAALIASNNGDIEQAYKMLKELPSEQRDPLLLRIYKNIVSSANDEAFIHAVYNDMDPQVVKASTDLQIRVAKRLLELGFYEKADELFASTMVLAATEENDLIRAQISMEQGQIETAQTLIQDYATTDAQILKAQLLERAGMYAQAAQIFQNIEGHNTDARRNFFLANDFEALKTNEADDYANLETLVAETLPKIDGLDGSLERMDQMLLESRKSRETISNLLEFSQ